MATTWKIVRVFISSTFRDMHAERDYLVRVVFPELRERLLPYRVHLVDIDLRWGVTREQAENNQVLGLCLQQIDECRPLFLGLLGQRYGWVPKQFPADAAAQYGWIQHHTGKSITELEIIYGVLDNRAMLGSAFFYFRDPSALADVPEAARRAVYEEQDPAAAVKLEQLKARIRKSGSPVFDGYPARWLADSHGHLGGSFGRLAGLEDFGNCACDQLWKAICQRLDVCAHPAAGDEPGDGRESENEGDLHEQFIELRLRGYAGREQVHEELLAYAAGRDRVACMITGPAGSGKSAVLARLAADYRLRHPETLVVPHFVGAAARSTSLRELLARLCRALQSRLQLADPLPGDARELAAVFRAPIAQVLPAIAEGRREDQRLLSRCPACGQPLRFNSVLADHRRHRPWWKVW